MKDTNWKKSQFIIKLIKVITGQNQRVYLSYCKWHHYLMFFSLCIWLNYRNTMISAQPGIAIVGMTVGSEDLDMVWGL